MIAPNVRQLSLLHPHAGALQAGQHLVAEIRHFVEIIDERESDPAHAGFADGGEFLGYRSACSLVWIAAEGFGGSVSAAMHLKRNCLRRDAFVGQHAIDRAPIGVFDDGVLIIVLGFLLIAPADHLADSEHFDPQKLIVLATALDFRATSARFGGGKEVRKLAVAHEERVSLAQQKGRSSDVESPRRLPSAGGAAR